MRISIGMIKPEMDLYMGTENYGSSSSSFFSNPIEKKDGF
jgi:hypothetical protein